MGATPSSRKTRSTVAKITNGKALGTDVNARIAQLKNRLEIEQKKFTALHVDDIVQEKMLQTRMEEIAAEIGTLSAQASKLRVVYPEDGQRVKGTLTINDLDSEPPNTEPETWVNWVGGVLSQIPSGWAQ